MNCDHSFKLMSVKLSMAPIYISSLTVVIYRWEQWKAIHTCRPMMITFTGIGLAGPGGFAKKSM